ncbi:MAG: hypothetical protein KJ737_23615 [Proteobacteria bacterium]|nr:hypothetical protein [Pseudomonadota bacterium]
MDFFSIEFWVGFQMVVELIIVFLILFYLRNLKTGIREDASRQVVEKVIEILEPLLKEAENTAKTFERQIQEKHLLINKINEKLDARIISLNLLMARSESHLKREMAAPSQEGFHVYDQQQAILDLYETGLDSESISKKLSMPKGEVDLVINLKKKFVSMD